MGVIKPFGNNYLRITTLLAPIWEKIKIKDIEIKNSYLSNRLTLVSQYKNFTLQYQFNVPVFALDGAFYTLMRIRTICFTIQKNGWTFTSGMYWIGVPSEYKSKSYSKSLVEFNQSILKFRTIRTCSFFGVAYDFSKGKNNEN